MNDSRSFIEPFKNRLFEVFNASGQGEDPYRHSFYEQGKGKKPKQDEVWEEESQNLFEDFLSLDEEKITQGMAKSRVKKAMDRKYRKSRRSEQLEEETRALEDSLDARDIAPEITAEKLAHAKDFASDVKRLIRTRHPALEGWLDLLSFSAWKHLSEQGFPPKLLLNLCILAYYVKTRREVSANPEALLYLQLHTQALNLQLRSGEVDEHVEKYTIDLDGFDSMVSQTLHALERHREMLDSFVELLQARCGEARVYALKRLGQPYLDPDRKLARFHLQQRQERLKDQVTQLQNRLQAQQRVDPEQMISLLPHWQGNSLYLGLLEVLQRCAQDGLPGSRERLAALLENQSLNWVEVERLLDHLELSQLENWLRPALSAEQIEAGFISDAVLEQNIADAIHNSDWTILDKWALCKAHYVDLFERQVVQELTAQLLQFLPPSLD